MAEVIPQRELRNHNARVVDAVASGQSFIVTRNGEPVAELRPYRRGRRTFVPKSEVLAFGRAGVRIDPDQFRADLDRVSDQDIER